MGGVLHAVKKPGTKRRYQELRQEEATLQQRRPQSVDADSLMSHVTQCEVEYRQKETKHRQEIEQCTAETEIITKSNEEKQREVEEHEERLKEVEATDMESPGVVLSFKSAFEVGNISCCCSPTVVAKR